MRSNLKAIVAVVGVLLVVIAVSLIIINRGPLYGRDDDDNWVPNMVGSWTLEGAAYYFEDVTDPACVPLYIEISSDPDPEGEGNMHITDQTGRVFAGTWWSPPDVVRKLAGVILPDRTVSIQVFETSEFRGFFTGSMTKSGSTLQISGHMHAFDDIGLGGVSTMSSGYVRLVKVD